jgi:hypothetical protein
LTPVELRAERGRAVLVGAPELFEPPTALAGALNEWAEVAAAVCADGETDPAAAELVSARGRQLAARLAVAAGTAVGYSDPVRGVLEHVPAIGTTGGMAGGTVSGTFGGTASRRPDGAPWPPPDHAGESLREHAAEPPRWPAVEPTPWATGLTVSAFVASVVLAAVVSLIRGLGEMAWWLGGLGLLVVTGGLAPSIWLARHTPLWRWLSYGVAAGLALSWVAVLLSALGP